VHLPSLGMFGSVPELVRVARPGRSSLQTPERSPW
jgi:hypothetical protein